MSSSASSGSAQIFSFFLNKPNKYWQNYWQHYCQLQESCISGSLLSLHNRFIQLNSSQSISQT